MSGPVNATEKEWGVNYRALNDLFQISRERKFFSYDIAIQMIEIYNEQVRDLLAGSSSQKKLGIWNSTQPNGLAVPDATIRPVTSTRDVIDLMQVGLNNRAVSSTALNQRSSRSHSVLTVHVKGTELETGLVFRGSLHLVDLAGSERVDRSEVTGDRLKEAQHINKSLAALGDVIFALSQKSSHVPYRNSKLTQVLQASLGGQAKTLMFVQLNPDIDSYSETLSTLKFAERVSGVELGAARSNKEGKDVKDLMDQLAFLKDAIVKKDEEIERLQILKFDRSSSTNVSGENSMRRVSSSPNVEMQQHTDEDSEGKLSDDSAHSMGIETDSSTFNSTESIQQPSFATTAESLGKKVKVSSPRVRPLHKPSVQALSPRLALKESSRLSTSSLKSTITRATTISSTKSTGKRWS